MDAYAGVLVELSKKMPFVHENCLEEAEPNRRGKGNVIPWPYMIACNLNARLQLQQRGAR